MSNTTTTALKPVTRDIVDTVTSKVKEFQQKRALQFPENYSPENALKSAGLILQETKDRNGNLAINVCSHSSIANALLNMVIQGLNPIKQQCYFIVYGKTLSMQRSYFGSMQVAKMVDPTIKDIISEVVYEGDEFIYEKQKGKTVIVKHAQKLENISKTKIKAAYCSMFYTDGSENSTIMTIEEIYQAWMQGQIKPIKDGKLDPDTTHGKFTAEMAKKTVINRACKIIINASDDESILRHSYDETEQISAEAETEFEIAENANAIDIDVEKDSEAEGVDAKEVDAETGEITKAQKEKPASPTISDAEQMSF